MTLSRGFVRNAPVTPLDNRLMDMQKYVTDAGGNPRVGVIGHINNLLTALGTMHVSVDPSGFLLSKGKADGVTILTNDGTWNVPITAAPVSNSRITSIWVKQNDDTTGDANALPVFGTTDGAAAAIPVAPAIPTGALELGQLRVYSGTTAANGGANTLTSTYQYTNVKNAPVYFRTKADLDAWTIAPTGQSAVVVDPSTFAVSAYMKIVGGWERQGGGLVLLGRTTFAAAGTPTLDGVFSSAFRNYLVRVNINALSAGGSVAMRLRAGGTPATGGTDYYAVSRTNNGAGITGAGVAGSSMPLTKVNVTALYAEARLFDVGSALRSAFLIDSHGYAASASAENGTISGHHVPATAHDGIMLITSGPNLTGEMSVYGLV